MGTKISKSVTWVGKVDWDLKQFHGNEFSTHSGSSYNSYLVEDEKTVLIDTVWLPHDQEFLTNLKKHIDLKKIDAIIANHSEIDHSGALPELLREIPGTPVYCTKNGKELLKGHYHCDWNFVTVKTGDTLNIGKHTLTFVEAQMLHWPDTMMTYMDGENILFSNDVFGQHYASSNLFNDSVDTDKLFKEAIKYYANIVTPFSAIANRKLKEVAGMNLAIDMICPSHGILWKDSPMQIVEKYLAWSSNYSENQITICYDTMWNSTKMMAEAICDGIKSVDKEVTVQLLNVGKEDKNDIVTEVFKSRMVLFGCPTINNELSYAMAGLLDMLKGLKMKNKKAMAFGSYGWSGESVAHINEILTKAGYGLVDDGLRFKWVPTQEDLETCHALGVKLGNLER